MNAKIAIVAPVHVAVTEEWVKALDVQRKFADIIIVDDSDGRINLEGWFDSYNYADQKKALGPELYELFEQFHYSSSCKQFGLWQAWKLGYDIIIVIDSDCIVPFNFVKQHVLNLTMAGSLWNNPLARLSNLWPRGYPYYMRLVPKWAHMGMWEGEIDLYGRDRVNVPKEHIPIKLTGVIPEVNDGMFFPLSGMNVSFVREALPYMLFLPNFDIKGKELKRHDDIWGGYIFQKIAQRKFRGLSYGGPFVFHDTIIIPEEDAENEAPMIENEKYFYSFIDRAFAFEETIPIWEHLARTAEMNSHFSGLVNAFKFQAKAFA